MRVELVTPRALAAIPIEMVRQWLAYAPEVASETRVLEQLIDEALAAWEARTDGHVIGSQTWRIWFDAAEVRGQWLLPLGPVVSVTSVTSITSYDPNDAATVLPATNYQVVAGEYGYVTTTADATMPSSLRSRDAWAVLVVVGATGAKVPYVCPVGTVTLDDLMVSGLYVGIGRALYEIEVQTAATPDTFRWRRVTHDAYWNRTLGAWTSGVAMLGTAQALGVDGISITWQATTGHAAGDDWTVEVREALDNDIMLALKGLVQFYYRTKGSGLIETASGQLVSLPYNVAELIDGYRRHSINPFGLDPLVGVE